MPTLPPNKKYPLSNYFIVIKTKLTLAFTGLLFFSLLNWDCTKIDTTDIGSGLIPAADNINTFELILPVVANNFDSIPFGKGCTTIYPTDDHVLGYISNDPLFGTTKAIIYTELKPVGFPFSFPATAVDRTLDSVVLILSYHKAFGDSTLQQTAEVHAISNIFKPDSSTCTSYNFDAAILGSANYKPERLRDTVRSFGDTSAKPQQLRIKLSNAFGQSLLAQDSVGTHPFSSDTAFKKYFPGFAITPNNTGNALSYFSITDPNTRLAIYYKYKRTGLLDTAVVTNFGLHFGGASANNIVRNHTGAELSQFLAHPLAGDSLIFIQTTPGSYAQLTIPGLSGLSNRIIHRAELIMDQVTPLPTDPFATPNILYLDLKYDDASYRPIPCDFSFSSGQPNIATFGGFKTTVKDPFGNNIARYTFNISRYVQKIVTNKRTNSVLRLRAPDYITSSIGYVDDCNLFVPAFLSPYNQLAYGRVKLGGGNNTNYKMRLRIIYSNL